MSATAAPSAPAGGEQPTAALDALNAELAALAAEEGLPAPAPLAETPPPAPAAPPPAPAAPAGAEETPPTTPESTPASPSAQPPATDWEAIARKAELDRRAAEGRIEAERRARQEAEERARAKEAEVDDLYRQAARQARQQGDEAGADRFDAELARREATRRDQGLAAREERVQQAERQIEDTLTRQQAAALAARTPGVMAGAVEPLLADVLRDHEGLERADLERRAHAWLARPSVVARMATIIPAASDAERGVHNPRFDDLVVDFRDHLYSHAESLAERKAAAAAAARDELAGKVRMEGHGSGGAPGNKYDQMSDEEFAKLLEE